MRGDGAHAPLKFGDQVRKHGGERARSRSSELAAVQAHGSAGSAVPMARKGHSVKITQAGLF